MIRKVALAVALAVGTLPFSAFGLGLGGIKTQSALNQEFKADIQLYSVPKGELDTVRVSLADTKHFLRAGVDRYFFLTRLQFETIRKADGTAVVRITSREPIREPFLDFLVEVVWPKGSMIKEYTVLLDPPTTTSRRPQAVKQATTPRASNQRTASRPSSARVTQQPGSQAGAEQYGPVIANETMWNIADNLRPGGITVHQMMMALQDANPSAFINGNINLLKKGVILRVPQNDSLQTIDNNAATSDFTQQTQDWLSGTPQDAAADTDHTGAMTPAATADSNTVESNARLEIAKTDNSAGGAGTGAGDAGDGMDQQLITARENAETERQNAGVLETEVGDLKNQVEDLQRLLVLKDKQLAQLQANVAGGEDSAETDELVGEVDSSQSMSDEVMSDETMSEATDVTDEVMVDDVESAADPVMEVEPEPVAIDESEQDPEPAMAQMSEEQLSWVDKNLPMLLGLGLAGLLALGGMLAFMRRNKFQDEQWEKTKREMEESMLLADTEDLESVLAEIVDDDVQTNDTSFLSEYSTEELQTLQEDTTETDPLSEADVYVAYGRYQQAQELLEAALVEQPERAAIKHKMLEIHYATQDKKAFFALAKEMIDAGQDKADLPAWEQVTVMATDLDPSNALFGTGEAASMGETIDLSQLTDDLESKLQEEDTQSTESLGLDSIDLGGSSRLTPDSRAAEDAVELAGTAVGGDDTELHTEMRDASLLTEFTDGETESLEDELAELEGDLEELILDPEEAGGDVDADQLADELADISGGAGDSIIAGDGGSDTETLGISEFTEPTTEIEVETKLELAQAYIDMGDKEGAQEIIQEILTEGTDAQISKANDIKQTLNG